MKNVFWILLPALLVAGAPLWAQQEEAPKKEKIIIIKKTVDEDGTEVTEKIVKEIDADNSVAWEWNEEEKQLVEIHLDELETELKRMEIWIEDAFGPAFQEKMQKLERKLEKEWGPNMMEDLKQIEEQLEEWGENQRIIITKKKKPKVL